MHEVFKIYIFYKYIIDIHNITFKRYCTYICIFKPFYKTCYLLIYKEHCVKNIIRISFKNINSHHTSAVLKTCIFNSVKY
jgi:hypothetical protein